ncbi:hypothetical protein QE380_002263 [Acinetobacter baylyi]|uniref:Phenol degradation protein meta n=1 Tax=Acinetobacter baylyi TaxID=202950 RepID=A0ABU0UXQ7_ACIBI|nr:transporter [Acinetobacter baylyi]MDQ1209340.1 hypothetical protein [Acinetobacter baylyi]MDR6107067.1 hypothetical protein [Acinetobacter baylyi]MDR6186212.1 hypothetical protein [Acinetobacter baylyi]
MKISKILWIILCSSCYSVYAATPSVTLPGGVNLGATSFYDGFGGRQGDSIWQTYVGYTDAQDMKNQQGDNALPGSSSLTSTVVINQYIHMFKDSKPILGGNPGIEINVPYIFLDGDTQFPVDLKTNSAGVGDPTVALFIQHDPLIRNQQPFFSDRISVGVMSPLGDYDKNKDFNPGSNYFSLFVYAAMTFQFNPKWSLSLRPYYYYNFQNDSPASSMPLDADIKNTQSGQFFTTNYNLGYQLNDHLALGINGYYLKQLTNDKVNGETLKNSKEQVFAIGPAAMLDYGRNKFYLTAHKESQVENRFKAESNMTLRWLHIF